MLGATLLSALAFTGFAGTSGGMWWSEEVPRAGTDYVALSVPGGGAGFSVGASIAGKPVETIVYRLTDPAVTVYVFRIPKGTAGKKLQYGYSLETRAGQAITIAHGVGRPKLIRR